MSTMWHLVSFTNYNSRAAVVAQPILHLNVGLVLGYGENTHYPEHQTCICGIPNSYESLTLFSWCVLGGSVHTVKENAETLVLLLRRLD